MKTTHLKQLTCFFLFTLFFSSCFDQEKEHKYLETVLNNLNKIKSAEYEERRVVWNPYEADPVFDFLRHIKEYDNPSDTTIGASYVELSTESTTPFKFAYDGKVRVLVWDDVNTLGIDSFNVDRGLPFRFVAPPFYNYTKNIINYMLTTTDSITIDKEENDSSFHIKLTIHEDRQVEFFGKAYKMPHAPSFVDDPTSVYEIWIDRKTDLPYKYRREMSHSINENTVITSQFNSNNINDLDISGYFPSGYEIIDYKERMQQRNNEKTDGLEGTIASEFSLEDTHGNQVSLKDLQGKVILLQFTGIGCGPCLLSIPFMEEIYKEYPKNELTVVSIETWRDKMQTLKNYQSVHQFSYTFLKSDEAVIKNYESTSVPSFFILDKNRKIRKIFKGFDENRTNSAVRKIIDELLDE